MKLSYFTFIGGILMIVGTSIGGGMLALPIMTAQGGFLYSTLLIIACWFLMTAGAFLILEVNLFLPEGTNILSMTEKTLGKKWKFIACASYLILLYSLLSAYMSGGGEVIRGLLSYIHLSISSFLSVLLFVLIFSCVLIRGIGAVDKVNRFIMALKLAAFFYILTLTLKHTYFSYIQPGKATQLLHTITTVMTSFGFGMIVPSLRSYFKSDVKKLKQAILIGSLIPLIIYLLWEFAIFASIPTHGPYGLFHLSLARDRPVLALIDSLIHNINSKGIIAASNIFTTVCIFTAFLGVSLCFIDFLIDGLKIKKTFYNKIMVCLITFSPPMIFVFLIPSVFTFGISLAGAFCLILHTIMPAFMAWKGRENKSILKNYRFFGGKLMLFSIIIISLICIGIDFI